MNCPHCQASNSAEDGPCFECGQPLEPATQAPQITKGSLIAKRYEVLEVLGRGGMGVVYKAHDRLLEEDVAIKVLKRELIAAPEAAKRFRTEIKLARRVSHPNVCRIHEYGEDGELSYISMAFVEGGDLRQRLASFPEGLPGDEAFDLAIQAARGLQAIHDAGVIHRDFKTPNIMRQSNGTIQLMDFGIAKETGRQAAGLTATGMVVGTPEFMSPEQCRGKPLDARSDVYSLGIVVFELFTGRVPFLGDSLMATLLKQLEEAPPLEGPGSERLPPSVVPVLRKALAKAPAERYERAIDVALALEGARALASGAPASQVGAPAPIGSRPPVEKRSDSRKERRRATRLELPLDITLKQIGPHGAVLLQERTLADNISRTGMRVMTSLGSIGAGDTVQVQEVGGDFRTEARVRHRFVSGDGIGRLGLEFVDNEAPDRLVRTGEWTSTFVARSRPGTPAPTPGPTQARTPTPAPVVPRSAAPARPERRSSSRISIPLELSLERLGPTGEAVQTERTLAENVGRGGAQVLTALPSVAVGELVRLTERGGDFQTRAAVRSAYTAPDGIRRLNLEFLDRQAPDRLVPVEVEVGAGRARAAHKAPGPSAATPSALAAQAGELGGTPVPPSAAPRAAPAAVERRDVLQLFAALRTRNHYEILGLARGADEAAVREAYMALVRRYHPDALRSESLAGLQAELGAIMARLSEAQQVLTDRRKRAKYEEYLGPERRPRTPTPSPAALPVAGAASVVEPPPPISIENRLHHAQDLIKHEKYWDAIQELEAALPQAPSPGQRRAVQVLLARAMLKNPRWVRRSEELLIEVTQEDPKHVEALLLLAGIYRDKSLRTRAERLLHRVLELDPHHAAAAAELRGLTGHT